MNMQQVLAQTVEGITKLEDPLKIGEVYGEMWAGDKTAVIVQVVATRIEHAEDVRQFLESAAVGALEGMTGTPAVISTSNS